MDRLFDATGDRRTLAQISWLRIIKNRCPQGHIVRCHMSIDIGCVAA